MGWGVLARRRWKRVRKKHPMTIRARLVEINTTPYPVSFIFIWLDWLAASLRVLLSPLPPWEYQHTPKHIAF